MTAQYQFTDILLTARVLRTETAAANPPTVRFGDRVEALTEKNL